MSKFSLHFLPIIAGQKKEFYQTNGGLFERLPETFLTNAEFENYIEYQQSQLAYALNENELALPEKSDEFLKELFLLKLEINEASKIVGEAERKQKLDQLAKSDNLKKLILRTVKSAIQDDDHSLIEPSEEGKSDEEKTALKEQRLQALLQKFTNYVEVADADFLTLYLQFLVRLNFFENEEDKANLFVAFHSDIEQCIGGMITRLEQYVGNNIIAENIATSIKKEIHKASKAVGEFVHTSSFVDKYLLGLNSKDPHAIAAAPYIPIDLLEKLSVQSLTGDYLERALSAEFIDFLESFVDMQDSETDLADFKFNNPQTNPAITRLDRIAKTILVAISDQREQIEMARIIPLTTFQERIVFDKDLQPRNKEDREMAVNIVKGNTGADHFSFIDDYRSIALDETQKRIQSIAEATPALRRKNALIDEETKADLTKLGVLYSCFLTNIEHVNWGESKFLEYIDKLCDYRRLDDVSTEQEQYFAITLKNDLGKYLPDTIRNFISEKLSLLKIIGSRTEQGLKLNLHSESAAMIPLLQRIKSVEGFVSSVIAQTVAVQAGAQNEIAIGFNESAIVSNYNLLQNVDPKKIVFHALPPSLWPEAGNITIPSKNFWHIFINYKVFYTQQSAHGGQIILDNKNNFSSLLTPVLSGYYGATLLDDDQTSFFELFNNYLPRQNDPSIPNAVKVVLASQTGQILLEKFPDFFFFEVVKLGENLEEFASKALRTSQGQNLLATKPQAFFKILFSLNEESFKSFFNDEVGKNIVKNHQDQFLEQIQQKKFATQNFLKTQAAEDVAKKDIAKTFALLRTASKAEPRPQFPAFGAMPFYGAGMGMFSSSQTAQSLPDQPQIEGHVVTDILNNLRNAFTDSDTLNSFISQLQLPENQIFIAPTLSSQVGIVLIENHADVFQKIFEKLDEKDKSNFYESDTGIYILENNPELFFRETENISPSEKNWIYFGRVRTILLQKYPDKLYEHITTNDNAKATFFNSELGKEMIEKNPAMFHSIIDSFRQNSENQDRILISLLSSPVGSTLFEQDNNQYMNLLSQTNDVLAILMGSSGEMIHRRYPEKYLELLSELPTDQLRMVIMTSGKSFIQNVFALANNIQIGVDENREITVSNLFGLQVEYVNEKFPQIKTDGDHFTISIEQLKEICKPKNSVRNTVAQEMMPQHGQVREE